MRRDADALEGNSEVAEHMADALTYLMRVADEAGLEEVSLDLLQIRNKLLLIVEDTDDGKLVEFGSPKR